MKQASDYIATWFYRESESEAGYYPQIGQKGSSALAHSVYMQIQVPFFRTFRHCNPEARLLFFTNIEEAGLPAFLREMFSELGVETITLPYACRPPESWYPAWQNQFYLYDILRKMGEVMQADDTLLVCDADCLCRWPLDPLFESVRRKGSALYEFVTDRAYVINGITLPQMEDFCQACYGEPPRSGMTYYGGEFVALRGDVVRRINDAYPRLWAFNLERFARKEPKLNEEAHVMSLLAEHLGIRNADANRYVKRMWTTPKFNNVRPGDEDYAVWHLPYEKKRGLHGLYRLFLRDGGAMRDEAAFWKRAGAYTGIPRIGMGKRLRDRMITLWMKLK